MASRWLNLCGGATNDLAAFVRRPPPPPPQRIDAVSPRLLRPFHSREGRRTTAQATAGATRDAEVKSFEEIPGPKPLPLIGNLWRFLPFIGEFSGMNIKEMNHHMYNKYGPITKISGLKLNPPLIHAFRPKDVEMVFRSDGQWPMRPGLHAVLYYRNVLRKEQYQGIGGLLSENGSKWMESRSKVNPAMMQPRTSKRYIPPIADVAQDFVNKMQAMRDHNDEMPPDFINELFKWSLESIAYVALDTRLGCLTENLPTDSEPQKMIDAVGDFFDCLYHLEMGIPFWKIYPTSSWKKFVKALDVFFETSEKYVNASVEESRQRKEGGSAGIGEPSVLERLLERASPREAVVFAQEMIFGGVDTTSYTVASALYCLSKNQDKQELLFQEIKKFLPKKDDTIKEEFLEDMKFLRGCLKEVLRLASPFNGNARVTSKEMVLSNYRVPPGVMVIMPNDITSESEEIFPQSKRFVPERWLKLRPTTNSIGSIEDFDAVNTGKRTPFALIPFGFGPRSCVGRRFAELEVLILLMKIIRNFKVEYNYGEMTYECKVLIMPKDPLRFKLTERKE